ncbi:MAG: hypothetical protein HC908_11880 [Calothrix sp. SM1_7_51]|nr:hypothetical protein [Calothrix sp. SM1_7_51]
MDNTDEECMLLAKQYATALLAGTNLKLVEVNHDKTETLFDSLLFEYQAFDPNYRDNPAKQCHIIVSINNRKADTVKLLGEAYDWLLYLLHSRHKILYIYQQACECNLHTRKFYSKLNDDMGNLANLIYDREKRLDNLRDLLERMPSDDINYSLCLRNLIACRTAIFANTANSHTCLDKIAILGKYPSSWDEFVNLKCKQWEQQVLIDIEFLSPGKELFGQMIQTIRGIVGIDQAENDRKKQDFLYKQDLEQKERSETTQKLLRDREESDKKRDRNLQNTVDYRRCSFRCCTNWF